MTDAEKCCLYLDYTGYEAHHLDGDVWITMWNRELTQTLELKISIDEVRYCAHDFDQEYKLHESFRKWLEESQTLVRLVPENKDDE